MLGWRPYALGVQKSALLLVDHGSRRAEANAQLDALAELVRERVGESVPVRVAHLELAPPSIAEGVAACAEAGAEEVVVVPFFLAPGRHAREDVPRLAREAAREHGLAVQIGEPLGVHPLLADLVLVRAGVAPAAERFALMRQDDNGNRFRMQGFETLEAARDRLDELEVHTHEQCYWIEREIT